MDGVRPKTKTHMKYPINIYLDPKEKKQLTELKDKYHLSFSTMANIIANIYYEILSNSLEETYLYNTDTTERIDKKLGLMAKKTSIKPRDANKYRDKTKLYTNAILMFLKKDKKYLGDHFEKCNNKIYAEFQNTYDPNWNGNQLSRFIPRFIKQNPDYIQKLINQTK